MVYVEPDRRHLDLAYVAAGRLDAALELELAPWDMAAGVLLVQEAGGIACDIKGGENYFTDATYYWLQTQNFAHYY